jgi:SAM-dependent methyltransferase
MRRLADSRFATRYFVGEGIDIGCGPDPISFYAELFPLMRTVRNWDLEDGDAQHLDGVPDASFDFVHSSHCLEHMRDPLVALRNWLRVLKPGGHMVIMVPDEDLYEQGVFPSTFNADHKFTFTVYKKTTWSRRSVNVLALIAQLDGVVPLKVELLDGTYLYRMERTDQTMLPVAECAIEFVLRKTTTMEAERGGRLPEPRA